MPETTLIHIHALPYVSRPAALQKDRTQRHIALEQAPDLRLRPKLLRCRRMDCRHEAHAAVQTFQQPLDLTGAQLIAQQHLRRHRAQRLLHCQRLRHSGQNIAVPRLRKAKALRLHREQLTPLIQHRHTATIVGEQTCQRTQHGSLAACRCACDQQTGGCCAQRLPPQLRLRKWQSPRDAHRQRGDISGLRQASVFPTGDRRHAHTMSTGQGKISPAQLLLIRKNRIVTQMDKTRLQLPVCQPQQRLLRLSCQPTASLNKKTFSPLCHRHRTPAAQPQLGDGRLRLLRHTEKDLRQLLRQFFHRLSVRLHPAAPLCPHYM